MLHVFGARQRFCDGLSRRDFLTVGTLGLGGLSLADLVRLRAHGDEAPRARVKSVIMVVLNGGLSHIDSYDLKPSAPSEFRGDFRPIQTNVPGFEISELMPLQAKIADKLALVRSLQTVDLNHNLHEVTTGFTFNEKRPAFGSVVSRLRPSADLPSYVSFLDVPVGTPNETAEAPSYLGTQHQPFRPRGEGLANFGRCQGVTPPRLEDRQALLIALDQFRREVDAKGEAGMLDVHTGRALDIISSGKARAAFDLSLEPDHVLEKYGGVQPYLAFNGVKDVQGSYDGRSFLLARRLVEAGVPMVTVGNGGWDHHDRLFPRMRSQLPLLDRSIYALITDLHERGLDKEVAVVVWGEFGRVPRITPKGDAGAGPGRGHHPSAGCVLMAGGGLKTGQVIGATDARAELPKARPLGPQNILATLYHLLGIDPTQTFPTNTGRPMYVLDEREPVAELL